MWCRGDLRSPAVLRFSCSSAYVRGCSFRLGEKNQKPPGGHNGGCGPRTPVHFSGSPGSKPSRGDLHSRVGGAGSAPPHDRCPVFGIDQALLHRSPTQRTIHFHM